MGDFVGGMDNTGVIEAPGTTKAEKLTEYDRVTDLLAPGGSFIAFPHVADFSLIPDQVGEHFKYGVPYYKKHNMGTWNK